MTQPPFADQGRPEGLGAARPRLSLIVPAYNEAEGAHGLVEFWREIRLAHPDLEVDLVVVDDGSTDGTAEAMIDAARGDAGATVISLSRNFGSHAAITAALDHVTGDAALTLSADRQEPLSSIGDFVAAWRDGAQIVWGLRSTRATAKGAAESAATGFSKFYATHSDVPTYPAQGPSQILVTREVIEVLKAMPERNRNVLAMAAWTGFDQREVFFEQLPRPYGASKWTSVKKIKLVIDSFVEFSAEPIRWIMYAGIGLGLLGLIALLAALVLVFLPGSYAVGLIVLGAVVALVGALITGALSVVGEYVWRAGDDARRRPVYLVSAIRSSSADPTTGTGDSLANGAATGTSGSES